MSVEVAGVKVGPDQPCRVIAELSNAHNGSLDLALRLIEECADAGADLIKFQCYTPDELVRLRGDGPAPDPWGSDGWTMRRLYEKAETPHAWFPSLVNKCERVGVPWFSSVFGMDSLALLVSLDCPAYKIAALDVGRPGLDSLVCELRDHVGMPIVASSRNGRVGWADLTLYCPPGYPQDGWDFFAGAAIRGLDGISYHGTDVYLPMWAAKHCQMVEVHVQLDDVPSELESNVSLTVSQLRELCEAAKGARV